MIFSHLNLQQEKKTCTSMTPSGVSYIYGGLLIGIRGILLSGQLLMMNGCLLSPADDRKS